MSANSYSQRKTIRLDPVAYSEPVANEEVQGVVEYIPNNPVCQGMVEIGKNII